MKTKKSKVKARYYKLLDKQGKTVDYCMILSGISPGKLNWIEISEAAYDRARGI